MKSIIDFIRRTMSMSPAEARGAILFFVGILLVGAMPFVLDYFSEKKASNLQISNPRQLDSLTLVIDETSKSQYQNYNYDKPSYNSKSPNVVHYKPFDPNTTSAEEMTAAGVPKFVANIIVKYRSKGGKFKKKEDLTKIYGVSPDLYERLEPYIALPSAENDATQTPQAQVTELSKNSLPNENYPQNKPTNYPAKEVATAFDLNRCDTTDLKKLKGIGSGYAKRIIKFRESLGGFTAVEQVKETFGLPPETADEILKFATLRLSPVRKLKISQATQEELDRHPYINATQARVMVAYRQQNGIKSAEDLRKIKVLDEATIQRILPYLEF